MRIIVGSTNKVKVDAIKKIFLDYEVTGKPMASHVSDQPLSDEETIKGAINRALGAKRYGDIGIGLEGGVQQTSFGMLVISYGALVDVNHKIYIAGGMRILLPFEVWKEIYNGRELGHIMDEYASKVGVKHDEGAVGVLTNNVVKRQEVFEHIGKLLLGQMLTGKTNVELNSYYYRFNDEEDR